jgi:hypothetical protein
MKTYREVDIRSLGKEGFWFNYGGTAAICQQDPCNARWQQLRNAELDNWNGSTITYA